jgi:hypothetical protein
MGPLPRPSTARRPMGPRRPVPGVDRSRSANSATGKDGGTGGSNTLRVAMLGHVRGLRNSGSITGAINRTHVSHWSAGAHSSPLCTTSSRSLLYPRPGRGDSRTPTRRKWDFGSGCGVFCWGCGVSPTSVTVTAILQPVTVTVTPSAGTVNIILNGVAQGAGPVIAPPNSTLRFSLTVPAVLGTKNTATIAIGDDSYSWWAGYADSSKQARIFVTSTTGYGNPGGSPEQMLTVIQGQRRLLWGSLRSGKR